jgi:hypothetical protein
MHRRWWTLVAVSLATFMTYIDNKTSIVNISRGPAPDAP